MFLNKQSIDLEPFFAEVSSGLRDEANYLREAKALSIYRDLFDGPLYRVPRVYHDYCGPRVLTMSHEKGTRLSDWINSNKQLPEKQEWLADRVLKLMTEEFFLHGVVQTDPNFGNFLVDENSGQLVLLDCGAVRSYPRPFRAEIRQLAQYAIDENKADMEKMMTKLQMLHPDEVPEAKDELIKLIVDIMALFQKKTQPVNFGDPDYLAQMRKRALQAVRKVKHSGPARQILFLNRKLGGMFHLLKEMGVRSDIHPYWLEVQGLDLEKK